MTHYSLSCLEIPHQVDRSKTPCVLGLPATHAQKLRLPVRESVLSLYIEVELFFRRCCLPAKATEKKNYHANFIFEALFDGPVG